MPPLRRRPKGGAGALNSRRRAICTTRVRGIATQASGRQNPQMQIRLTRKRNALYSRTFRTCRSCKRVLFRGEPRTSVIYLGAAVSCRQTTYPGIGRATLNCRVYTVLQPAGRTAGATSPRGGLLPAFSPLPWEIPCGRFFCYAPIPSRISVISLRGALRCPISSPATAATAMKRTCTAKVINSAVFRFGGDDSKCVSILRAGRRCGAGELFGNVGLNSTFAKRLIPSRRQPNRANNPAYD